MPNSNHHRTSHPSAGTSQRGMESPDAQILVFRPRSLRDIEQYEALDEELCDSIWSVQENLGLLQRHPSIEGSLTNLRSTGEGR
jgi:hypothetical protein